MTEVISPIKQLELKINDLNYMSVNNKLEAKFRYSWLNLAVWEGRIDLIEKLININVKKEDKLERKETRPVGEAKEEENIEKEGVKETRPVDETKEEKIAETIH